MDFAFWRFNNTYIDAIQQNGDTVIALAYATSDVSGHPPDAYTFLCLLQFENTMQPGVREVIQGLSKNGIRCILLTGDRGETAAKIGRDSGIAEYTTAVLSGKVIDRMDLAEVARQAAYCSIFARLLPSQKGMLIRLLQQRGHWIAMVGDGPNDGIALKVADIGISYGVDSSPIARRLSDILIPNLAGLFRLFISARRIKGRARLMKVVRIFLIGFIILVPYLWIFSAQFISR